MLRFLIAPLLLAALLAQAAPPPEPAAAAYVPRPAEQSRRAAERLMLGLAEAGDHLIAVGDRGHLLASRDARRWLQVLPPVRSALNTVQFIGPREGWAVGEDAVVLHSRDGGEHWTLQNFEPERQRALLDLAFVDARRGVAVGALGLMLATEDGGQSWREVEAPALRGDELHLHGIVALADGALLVAGEQGLLGLSRDGGRHWTRLRAPADDSLFGAAPYGEQGVVICGLNGAAWLAPDLRRPRWQPLATGTTASLFAVATARDGSILLGGASGTLRRLATPEAAVQTLALPAGFGSVAALLPRADALVVAGNGGLSRVEWPR